MSAVDTAYSVGTPSNRAKTIACVLVVAYALITLVPLVWIVLTGFKSPPDSIAYPPKVTFEPTLEGYVNLFTSRSRQTPEYIESLGPPKTWYEELVRKRNMVITGPSRFKDRYLNSIIIGFGSTFLAVFLGTLAAYAFSRFKMPLKDDLLFFILSTRMMPPIAVAIPIYLMYRELGLSDTALGMILLYTAVNVSLAVWLLKGFVDEIPREYEEAAVIDGYSRISSLREGRAAPDARRHRRHRDLLPDLRLERICLRAASHQRRGADGAALHSDHHRRRRPGLAGGRGRHDAVPPADRDLHRPPAQPAAARHHVRGGAQMTAKAQKKTACSGACDIRPSGPISSPENTAHGRTPPLIGLGVFMLMQPFSLTGFSYSFAVILAGTVGFVIVSHFPE